MSKLVKGSPSFHLWFYKSRLSNKSHSTIWSLMLSCLHAELLHCFGFGNLLTVKIALHMRRIPSLGPVSRHRSTGEMHETVKPRLWSHGPYHPRHRSLWPVIVRLVRPAVQISEQC